jgi:multidrug efflux pump subunit AcrB
LLGVFAIRLLPISRYPQITPPAAAGPGDVPRRHGRGRRRGGRAALIEAQLSGLQGLLYYSSANASDGTMSLQIYST